MYRLRIRKIEPTTEGSLNLDVFIEREIVADEGLEKSVASWSLIEGGHKTAVLEAEELESAISGATTDKEKISAIKILLLKKVSPEKLVKSQDAYSLVTKYFGDKEVIVPIN